MHNEERNDTHVSRQPCRPDSSAAHYRSGAGAGGRVAAADRLQSCAAATGCAVRGAVNGLMVEVLDGYMRAQLIDGVSTAEKREQDMAQVSRVLHSYLK